jgi:methyl-accepting chemotaxis protein
LRLIILKGRCHEHINFNIRTKIVSLFIFFILAYLAVIFLWVLPAARQAVMKQKETLVQSLVQSVVAQVKEYHERAQRGEFSMQEAQERAKTRIKHLRYGPEGKDYFWINDLTPTMIMHPFRPDLDGKDLTSFKDPQGKALFVEFVKVCRDKGQGLVDYVWQWKDDKTRMEPKISYVQLFGPWGWILGTGLYINDVNEEIGALRNSLLMVIIPLTLVLLGLLIIPIRQLGRLAYLAENLATSAEEVRGASSQVSGVSQSLAQGSSEQAASLEETSASLEEMASMTRANADNARQADALMGEAAKVVDQANKSMAGLIAAMQEVSQASQDTAKIIKTIDEIAFQTNLLALNAAVEAARAGEAGAGFAVVADEVRALAMRAAEAAKNTASLIETTVGKVKEGSELVSKTAAAFAQVAGSTGKVKELVAEIAAASGEQAQGVDQINRAVTEMNTVTQQTAANAEESASAAEELNAQSETMKGVVAELVALVGGAHRLNGNQPALVQAAPQRPTPAARVSPRPAPKAEKSLPPPKAIPLEEDDFKDF